MRKFGNTSEVIKAFVGGKDSPWTNTHGTVFFTGNTLYSYGHHFPLAFRERTSDQIVMNGDKYSVTTSHHQSLVAYHAAGHLVTISVTAMSAAGFPEDHLLDWLIDHTPDLQRYFDKPLTESEARSLDLPDGVTFYTRVDKSDGKTQVLGYHRAGMSLWERNGACYIAGMDERQYFISKLPYKVETCDQALQALQPDTVRAAKHLGREVRRQGEWFFIDVTDLVDASDRAKFWDVCDRKVELVGLRPSANAHIAERLGFMFDVAFDPEKVGAIHALGISATHVLVTGRVLHPEHRTLKLGKRADRRIWVAYENTATGNWSAGGRVD